MEPIARGGWRLHCKIVSRDEADTAELPSSTVGVSYRPEMDELDARRQTADFLRFISSLAIEN